MTVPQDRAAVIERYAWNTANRRARDDYNAHPTTACRRTDCDQLAAVGPLCPAHTKDAAKALTRYHERNTTT